MIIIILFFIVVTMLAFIAMWVYFSTILCGSDFYSLMFTILNSLFTIWLIVPVIVLLKEKYDEGKPKMIISFELIRSSLICLVIKNIGNYEIELTSMKMNEEFIKQLDKKEFDGIKSLEETRILISPKKYWTLNLGVTTSTVLDTYDDKELEIIYKYRKVGKKKEYTEKLNVDFSKFANFMIYISELDEINTSIKKLTTAVEQGSKNIDNQFVETTRLLSSWTERQSIDKKSKM